MRSYIISKQRKKKQLKADWGMDNFATTIRSLGEFLRATFATEFVEILTSSLLLWPWPAFVRFLYFYESMYVYTRHRQRHFYRPRAIAFLPEENIEQVPR